ncbi:MAG TPA: hypothetical protein VM681_11145 [Candidatus Thermoplasmatota archaeon]|nr:hypothetical protein [Candidatus Thermoplasmatota archaeon]
MDARPQSLEGLVERLALLTAMNAIMAQTSFLAIERLRISTQVVDENVTNDFGAQLFAKCEGLVEASNREIEAIVRSPQLFAGREAEREALLSLLEARREFAGKLAPVPQKKREYESLERMYR